MFFQFAMLNCQRLSILRCFFSLREHHHPHCAMVACRVMQISSAGSRSPKKQVYVQVHNIPRFLDVYFTRENDHNPLDLEVHFFYTNPYVLQFFWCWYLYNSVYIHCSPLRDTWGIYIISCQCKGRQLGWFQLVKSRDFCGVGLIFYPNMFWWSNPHHDVIFGFSMFHLWVPHLVGGGPMGSIGSSFGSPVCPHSEVLMLGVKAGAHSGPWHFSRQFQ